MTRRLTILASLLFIITITADAQDLYRKGFVITQANDTIRGLINDTEVSRNPVSIDFKETESSTTKSYSTKEIKAFATSRGVYFESHQFKYDADAPAKGESSMLPDGYFASRSPEKFANTECFLEVLVKGTFSLYKYHDLNDRIHFLILDKGKTQPEELLYRPFKATGSTALNANESYKQQLVVISEARCPKIKSQITNVPYREKNLARVVTSINECLGDVEKIPTVDSEKSETKKAKFGIVAEPYISDPGFIVAAGGYSGLQFGGGISYEVFSKKRPNRVSFYSELKLKNFRSEDTYHAKHTVFNQTGELTYQTVKLTNMIRLYPGPILLNAGVVYGYRFNTKINDQVVTDRDARDRFEFGFAAGGGKKFTSIGLTIEPRFEINIPSGQKSFALVICKQL
jgi:hypothetical protein